MLASGRELGAALARGGDQIARFENARAGQFPRPLSFSVSQQALMDCMESANGIYGRLQTADALVQMAEQCRSYAASAMVSNPRYGFGALVFAQMSAIMGDWAGFNAMLRLSQQGASTEQWISVERLKLYTRYEAQLEPETIKARTADIDLLLESPIGVSSIANLYLDDEHLRELITRQAENKPQDVQRRFLRVIKNILGS